MKYHLSLVALTCALALSACGNNKTSGGNPALTSAPASQAGALVGHGQGVTAMAPKGTQPGEVDETDAGLAESTASSKVYGDNPVTALPADAIVSYTQQLAATAPDDTEPDEIDGTDLRLADSTEPSNL